MIGVRVFLFLLGAAAWTYGAEPVDLEIRSPKKLYLQGEPITIEIAITQRTSEPLMAPKPDIRFPGNGCRIIVRKEKGKTILRPYYATGRKDGRFDGFYVGSRSGCAIRKSEDRESETDFPIPEPAERILFPPGKSVRVVNILQTSYRESLGTGLLTLSVGWRFVSPMPRSNEVEIEIVEPEVLAKARREVDVGWDHEGRRKFEFGVVTYPKEVVAGEVRDVFIRGEIVRMRHGKEVGRDIVLFLPLGKAVVGREPELMFDGENALHILVMEAPGWFRHVRIERTALDLSRQLWRFGDTSRATPITIEYVTGYEVNLERTADGNVAARSKSADDGCRQTPTPEEAGE